MADTRQILEQQISSIEKELEYYNSKENLTQEESNTKFSLELTLRDLRATLAQL